MSISNLDFPDLTSWEADGRLVFKTFAGAKVRQIFDICKRKAKKKTENKSIPLQEATGLTRLKQKRISYAKELQECFGIEVVLLDILEVVECSDFEFFARRLVADDDSVPVHL